MTEVLHGLGDAARERVAALRAEGRFFWLDVSLGRTSFDDLVAALAIPQRAARALRGSGDRHPSRAFHANGESVVFALRCYVAAQAPAGEAAYRLHPLEVHVLVTGDYLPTLHQERVSLPAALDTDLPGERSRRYVVYSLLEGLIDSTFDALEEVEVRLDALAVTSTDGTGHPLPRATLREAAARLAEHPEGDLLPVATAALAWRFLLHRFLIGGDRSRSAPER